jgi:hypothetical protein
MTNAKSLATSAFGSVEIQVIPQRRSGVFETLVRPSPTGF